jgi:hypothetical protein
VPEKGAQLRATRACVCLAAALLLTATFASPALARKPKLELTYDSFPVPSGQEVDVQVELPEDSECVLYGGGDLGHDPASTIKLSKASVSAGTCANVVGTERITSLKLSANGTGSVTYKSKYPLKIEALDFPGHCVWSFPKLEGTFATDGFAEIKAESVSSKGVGGSCGTFFPEYLKQEFVISLYWSGDLLGTELVT